MAGNQLGPEQPCVRRMSGIGPPSRWANRWESGFPGFATVFLGFAMVVMTVMVVMRSRGERRSGEHEDQEHSSGDLLHGVNVARGGLWKYQWARHESSVETPGAGMR